MPILSSSISLPFSNLILPSSSPASHSDPKQRNLTLTARSTLTTSNTPSATTNSQSKSHVVVIGAGLAGLAAATKLYSENIPFLLLEASDGVGGRVRTDVVDGFLLDRGFQIFITAYPEARKLLDYQSLNLQKFYSGARVYYDGTFHNVADPVRHFSDSIATVTNPIGTVLDKLLIGLTRIKVLTKSDEEIFYSPEVRIIDLLKRSGFSESIIDRFFRPFFGGIFFDTELETTSRLFDFIFRCLALGDNTIPADGIGAIPGQLAAKLPADSIKLNSKVLEIDFGNSNTDSERSPVTVTLESGEVLKAENGVILAVEEPEAEKLLPRRLAGKSRPGRSTVCLYFVADRSQIPVNDPVLFLNGSGKGIVNNMFFATNVAPSYGPPDKALVSVSLIGLFRDKSDDELVGEVVGELSGWFGSTVSSWKHLRTYRIAFAQPNQCPPTDLMKDPEIEPNVYVCGDYRTSATFDGALVSGRKAVEALLRSKALIKRVLEV